MSRGSEGGGSLGVGRSRPLLATTHRPRSRLAPTAATLLARYIPGARLEVAWSGRRTEAVIVPEAHEVDHIPVRVLWRPSNGLTSLLHEIGHYRLRHFGPLHLERGLIAPTETVMWEEVCAWLWAERAARRHHVPFDYGQAERNFGTYCRQVRIAWRWGPADCASQSNSPGDWNTPPAC